MPTPANPHPSADILHAIADGKVIQESCYNGNGSLTWEDVEPDSVLIEIGEFGDATGRFRIRPD